MTRSVESFFSYPPVNRLAMASGCYVSSIGAVSHPPSASYPPPGHPEYFSFEWKKGRKLADTTLLLIIRGEGEWKSRSGQGKLVAGDALFLPSWEWHSYRPSAGIGWGEMWLCFRGSTIHQLTRRGILPSNIKVLNCDMVEELSLRIDRLHSDIRKQATINRPSWGARALSVALEVLEQQTRLESESESDAPSADWLERSLRYIHENSHRPITVEDVANACGRTRRTIERAFQAASLGTVAEMIVSERMERARIALRESTLSIKEIAADSGFHSTQHLIACFHRIERCTPSQYRRNSTARKAPPLIGNRIGLSKMPLRPL